MLPDPKDLERYVAELNKYLTRRVRYVDTDRLQKILEAFGFKCIQNRSSHIKFRHTEKRFSEVLGGIVYGSEKRNDYIDVANACLAVYEALLDDVEPKPLVAEFEPAVIDLETDSQKWLEQFEHGDGQVILRSKKFPVIGMVVSEDVADRKQAAAELSERLVAFRRTLHETVQKYDFDQEDNDDGSLHLSSRVYDLDYTIPVFDGPDNSDRPEDILFEAQTKTAEKDEVLIPWFDTFIKNNSFFRIEKEAKISKQSSRLKELAFYPGLYLAKVDYYTSPAERIAPRFIASMARYVRDVLKGYVSDSGLRKLGFQFELKRSGEISAEHKLDSEISFTVPKPDFMFDDAVEDGSLGDLDSEKLQRVLDELSVQLDEIGRVYAPLFDALGQIYTHCLESSNLLTETYGSNLDIGTPQTAFGEVQRVFIKPILGQGFLVNGMNLPYGSLRSDKRLLFVLKSDLEKALKLNAPDKSVPRLGSFSEVAPHSPLDGLSGLGIKRTGQSSTALPGILASPKPPWEKD